jgi:formylglycine-generating enzyme required for sulfatase activity/uncharacterized caspase-like protein
MSTPSEGTDRNLAGASSPVPTLGDAPVGEFHLLSIGIDRYAQWPALRTAVRGAEALGEILAQDYGFGRVTRLLNAQATRSGIVAELRQLAQTLTAGDSLIVYFAGHGHLDDVTGTGAWIPVDGQRPAGAEDHGAASSWIENLTIKTIFRACKARHILLVSDSCFAGDFLRAHREAPPVITDSYVRTSFSKASRQVITSGALEPVSDSGDEGHSVFTWFLLRGLRENREPWLLPSQLWDRVRDGVSANATQQVLLGTLHDCGGELGGEFVLFRSGQRTLESALSRRRERLTALEQAEADARQAREAQQQELLGKQAETAELDRRIAELQARLGSTTTAAGSGTLDELVDLVERREMEAAEMETLRIQAEEDRKRREAEIARLREEELTHRKAAFEADWKKYQRVIGSVRVTVEIRRAAWKAICAAWLPGFGESDPGNLVWLGDRVVVGAGGSVGCPFENSLGMKFVPVKVGIEKRRAMLFSVWETRVGDFGAYAAANEGVNTEWKNPGFTQEATHPVVNVSWTDSKKFCEWLTEKERKEGRIGKEQEYRLPTDEEWSWAVGIGEAEEKAGSKRTPAEKHEKIGLESHPQAFPWGKDWPPPKGAGNYADESAKRDIPTITVIDGYHDGFARTSPVGSFEATSPGLYDLGGNVWEWCEDFHDGESGTRVLRGGSWNFAAPRFLLSSYRNAFTPEGRDFSCGFRVLLTSQPAS